MGMVTLKRCPRVPAFMALEATGSHYELDLFQGIQTSYQKKKKKTLLNKNSKVLVGFFWGVGEREGHGDARTVLLKSTCY